MAKILVVDDEERILKLIRNILLQDGHTVTSCLSFDEVDEDSLQWFNMILLDVMMPGTDGFEACRRIRNKVDCPILFITAKTEEEDIVYGFGLGADDYIKKPFGMEELKARVNAHLRRESREHHVVLPMGDIQFDLHGMKLMVGNQSVNLTKGEYQICEFLARHKRQVFSREQIYEAVFGYDGESNDNTIATHIKNIRSKLDNVGVSPIQTVWGIGYKWEI
ncbi:response regulator transcription factor [Pseudobacteroides cellulosolvens]|uniref:Stage 0 sporulation protein A homolog n=1 Tax=Pseudobacteroides cellulosolvens ATCC 35603 = DSM 2933 TaxID=398512 RepID=A0A0L6JL05_9FIRM|nr:response regulator transcription factor [Pseudobacteroides cellulosolvens]KNY26403.1 two component transcriptional regulator, winged helix family [Pseudobacteroides cellulosolvens ATCC 35603 = DSM 2933]